VSETSGVGPIETVRVFTRDITLARKFYTRGLGLTERTSGPGYAMFSTGGADLVLEQVDEEEEDETEGLVGRVVGFSFTVEDCEATVASLKSVGVTIVSGPERQPWGGVLAFVEDADHNVLTLVENP
jgi:predicted enzyme related to lactoylglutathione lyase